MSPNADLYLNELGYEPSNGRPLPVENTDCPFSLHYINTEGLYITEANEKLVQLESLFRLFQPGNIYIRLHKIWELEQGKKIPFLALPGNPQVRPKPEAAPLWRGPGYDLSDKKLDEFRLFFDKYFTTVQNTQKKHPPLNVAVNRFNSSYDKRDIADRLIDLMIAIEALFRKSI